MHRRRYLELCLGGAVLLPGCLGDSDSSDPIDVIEQRWSAWEDRDTDAYLDILHPDGPYYADVEAEMDNGDGEEVDPDEIDWEIEDREVISEDDEEAVVEEVYVFDIPQDDPWRLTDRYTLRLEDGEWLIWDIQNIDFEYA